MARGTKLMKAGRTRVIRAQSFVLKSLSEARAVIQSRMLVKRKSQDSKILGYSQTDSMLEKQGHSERIQYQILLNRFLERLLQESSLLQPMPIVGSHHAKSASRVETPIVPCPERGGI